jgi:FkbM family methyltransferase
MMAEAFQARVASYFFSRFRKQSLRMTPDDLRNLRLSFSQFGEDLVIVEALLNLRLAEKGIYVDAGCFDPFRFSNTRLLHLLGWRGINIDGTPEVIAQFNRNRPADENICSVLSNCEENAAFGGAKNQSGKRLIRGTGHANDTKVRTTTLDAVIAASRFGDQKIDLLDIDCEGFDLTVLEGLNLAHHRPRIICIEAHTTPEQTAIEEHLSKLNYELLAERLPSRIFIDTHR